MQREKERKREAERGKENGSGIRRETGIETGRVQMEGRKRDERKGRRPGRLDRSLPVATTLDASTPGVVQ